VVDDASAHPDVRKIVGLLKLGATLHLAEWLDDQGCAAKSADARSMLRITLKTPQGRPIGFRVPIENIVDLIHATDLRPEQILA
jgi:hypothetical protein